MASLTEKDIQIIETELQRIAAVLLPAIQPEAVTQRTDLFNGSAGVLLFYLKLYEHYQDPAYLQTCISAADTLLYHPGILQQQYYTLYTGATGLLYLCIKMYETTGRQHYLDRALLLVAHFREGILQGVVQDDFLSGHAGNIFVLTYLHAHTQQEELLPIIKALADTMVLHARIAPQGLKWGHVKMSYDCLTGFSHGASGIAYGLLQAATYFQDEGLYYLATQALDYEMQYYDPETRNWLDLRLTSTHLRQEDILSWQLSRFREYASDTNTWAHGAAGVGMARLYAWQLFQRPDWLQQVLDALQRALEDAQLLKRGDFTLCSGYGGIVFFLLQAAVVLEQPDLRLTAQQIALQAVHYYLLHGTYNSYVPTKPLDPGLFSGLAGVGYMLLSALMPFREDTILHPVIRGTSQQAISPLYAPGEIKQRLFSRYYPNTVKQLSQHGKNLPDAADIHTWEILLQQEAAAMSSATRDCFAFEYQLTAMWKAHQGLLCHMRRKELLMADAGRLQDSPQDIWLHTVFVPVEQVQLCHTQWPWHLQEDMMDAGDYYYLLQSHEYGISVFPVGKLTAVIFSNLQHGRILQDIITLLFGQTAGEQAVATVIAQTSVMIQQGFIKRYH
ncbi:lanthionine synthetase LanC family protein [Chitinophaga sp. HK235]|uniref:lanthionine synthetase LanC family protein n=1 Tax=Chitinophaga sp. HK235 TaxID=2952571 RepID=UPI001BAD99EE|nr:lanthionine synthetase LanC family protein [Chitinophaga sp. HK235]